ncbi:MAG: hypothetical protein PUC06_06595 [Oscillospiraceae bacterium]|nr:hypothetical protein [Oscillospiraceae bacterium]
MKMRFGRLFVLIILLVLMVMPLSVMAVEEMPVSAEHAGAAVSASEESLMDMPVTQAVSGESGSSTEEVSYSSKRGDPIVVVVVLAASIIVVTGVALIRNRNRECM